MAIQPAIVVGHALDQPPIRLHDLEARLVIAGRPQHRNQLGRPSRDGSARAGCHQVGEDFSGSFVVEAGTLFGASGRLGLGGGQRRCQGRRRPNFGSSGLRGNAQRLPDQQTAQQGQRGEHRRISFPEVEWLPTSLTRRPPASTGGRGKSRARAPAKTAGPAGRLPVNLLLRFALRSGLMTGGRSGILTIVVVGLVLAIGIGASWAFSKLQLPDPEQADGRQLLAGRLPATWKISPSSFAAGWRCVWKSSSARPMFPWAGSAANLVRSIAAK